METAAPEMPATLRAEAVSERSFREPAVTAVSVRRRMAASTGTALRGRFPAVTGCRAPTTVATRHGDASTPRVIAVTGTLARTMTVFLALAITRLFPATTNWPARSTRAAHPPDAFTSLNARMTIPAPRTPAPLQAALMLPLPSAHSPSRSAWPRMFSLPPTMGWSPSPRRSHHLIRAAAPRR